MTNALEIDQIHPDRRKIADKWGVVADPGYLTLPYVLLLNQSRLKLSSENLNVLLNVLAHWHSADRMPFPHSNTIARRMGVSARTVQRSLARLRKMGFLSKVRKKRPSDPQAYDVRPLVSMLEPFALERAKLVPEMALDGDHLLAAALLAEPKRLPEALRKAHIDDVF